MAAKKALNPVKQLSVLNRLIDIGMAEQGIKSDLQLAALLGMNHASLSKRRSGATKWSWIEVCRVARVLEFSQDAILRAMAAA